MAAAGLAVLLAGCTPAPVPSGFDDPFEAENRKTHQLNRQVDLAFFRPISNAYGKSAPGPARKAFSNFSENLGLPGVVVNNLLQFRIEDAGANTFRFLLNTVFGFGGLMDVATEAGIAENASDFGETLYVWGVGEGNYIELPLLGPSTARDAVGKVVDIVTNPLNFGNSEKLRGAGAVSGGFARADDRFTFGELVDEVLHNSADSYAQARLLYLQNRRFQLSGEAQSEFSDPYEDVYGLE